MRMGVIVLVVAGLSGCASSHAPCPGPVPGRYDVVLGATEGTVAPCSAGVFFRLELEEGGLVLGSVVACEIGDQSADVCGAVATVACDVDDAAGIVERLVADLDLTWTDASFDGGAEIRFFDEAGVEVCRGEYDVTSTRTR